MFKRKNDSFIVTLSNILNCPERKLLAYRDSLLEMCFGVYYSRELVQDILKEVKADFTVVSTSDYDTWKEAIVDGLKTGYHVMLCVVRPGADVGEWCEITSGSSLEELYTSTQNVNNIAVNYGAINKCPIHVSKDRIDKEPRCGMGVCMITNNSRCCYTANVGGVVVLVRKREEAG